MNYRSPLAVSIREILKKDGGNIFVKDKALADLAALNLKQSQRKEAEIKITLEQQIKDDMGGNLSTTQEKYNIGENAWDTKLALNEVKLSQETKADPMGGYGSEID